MSLLTLIKGKIQLPFYKNIFKIEVWNYLEIDTLKQLQLLTIKEQLLYDIEAKHSLSCSEHETVRFQILGEATRQGTELQP